MTGRKKLIEVALPLDAINKASAREKSIRHGHPSTLHLWWARRPLAAARAVIFSQMVDDPSGYVGELLADSKLRRKAESVLKARRKRWEEASELARKAREFDMEAPDPGTEPTLEDVVAEQERERLFKIIEDLVQWENTTNETVLQAARDEIWQSWRRTCAENAGHPQVAELYNRQKLPAFHDPFAGGGSLPLEAQRLGLEAYATDLNPVAVLINKAMIEIPPKFAGHPPVNPEGQADKHLFEQDWKGVVGLAADVRYYGNWMREEAQKRLGKWYPKVKVTAQMAADRSDLQCVAEKELTVIAWLWSRTVYSPNPAFAHVQVPLASTFLLFTKPGSEAYIEPIVEENSYRFAVKLGKPTNGSVKDGTRLARGANFRCLMSGSPITPDYIMSEGKANRVGTRMMAIVAEGDRGRVYLPPSESAEEVARQVKPEWHPDVEFFQQALGFRVGNYGMSKWSDLFTPRQLLALTTLSDLTAEVRDRVKQDAEAIGFGTEDERPLAEAGSGATAYSEAVAMYLAFNVSKLSDLNNSLVTWKLDRACPVHLFARQAIPMVWDFPEANPLSESSGSWDSVLWHLMTSMTDVCLAPAGKGHANQCDAGDFKPTEARVVSTDPPYYDNVGYADLSDFFYVWLRRSLRWTFPDLFATLAVPKAEELVATAARHGGKDKAEMFFLNGMTQAMRGLAEEAHPAFPVTIYYAFKQAESAKEGTASTGWETFLDAVICAGFAITGTLPMRTELGNRMRGMGSNALASSIVLVCRKRHVEVSSATRREFLARLKGELPKALALLQAGNIAPVDLAQAAIGPGMAVYTRYSKVLDAEGKPMAVREALALINQVLDESLASQEGDFDADSRWALAWFEQSAFEEGEYGIAETLSKAKNTSVSGLVQAGILTSKSGKVRLLRPEELPPDWDPTTDPRLTTWEMVHHLIRALESGGESAAAALVAKLGTRAETARELCYRLYTICERKKRAAEALSYNALVQSWPEIARLAREGGPTVEQGELFGATP